MATSKSKPLKTARPKSDHGATEEVTLVCGCNRDVTATELGKIYSACGKSRIDQFLAHINKAFTNYGISSCLQKSHFLAQVGHESGQLRYVAEAGITAEVERKNYKGYKGRGLIQITYKDMYEKYGNAVGHNFLDESKKDLEETSWASDSAGWFWKHGKSVDLSSYAAKNDLIYISQKINGAYNGFNDRKSLFQRGYKALLVDNCQNSSMCWDIENFTLPTSAAFAEAAPSFAWGLWHDSTSTKSGVTKSDALALEGYSRFLELEVASPRPPKFKKKGKAMVQVADGRFGYKYWQDMVKHAQERVNALSSATPSNGAGE